MYGCWVWKLVNTTLKFNYDENSDVKKIVNYWKKNKQKKKTIATILTNNKKCLKLQKNIQIK